MLPAYAGLLGSMGLTFLLQTMYLLPITVVALVVVIALLGFRARRRRGYGPFVLGLVATGLVLVGKFALELDSATYTGIALLILASVWNSWPIKSVNRGPVEIALPDNVSRNR